MRVSKQDIQMRHDYELDGKSVRNKVIRGGDNHSEVHSNGVSAGNDWVQRHNAKPVKRIFK